MTEEKTSLPFDLVFLTEEQKIKGEVHTHVITFWPNGVIKGNRRIPFRIRNKE